MLFRSLVVFENYPINPDHNNKHNLTITHVTAEEATNYPLTLVAPLVRARRGVRAIHCWIRFAPITT